MQLLVWKIDEEKPIKKSDRSSFKVHMSSSSEFQAVDLDAVLDEFESSQNLVEQNTTMGKEDHKSENVIKPHLLENLNALPESPPTKTVRLHTVRNLHFLSKNSTFISRNNCRSFLGWKTREIVVVLDFLAVDNFDFTRKIVKKFLGEKLVKMLWFWTF